MDYSDYRSDREVVRQSRLRCRIIQIPASGVVSCVMTDETRGNLQLGRETSPANPLRGPTFIISPSIPQMMPTFPEFASLITGLVFLGVSSAIRRQESGIAGMVGWSAVAVFWSIETAGYLGFNPTNAVFTLLAAAFSIYMVLQMLLSLCEEMPAAVRFATTMAFLSGLIYYSFEWVPILNSGLVYFVTLETVGVFRLAGLNYSAGFPQLDAQGNYYVHISPTPVSIILACTGIQAIALFAAAIMAVRAPRKKKYQALVFSITAIHLLNIVRNVLIIHLVVTYGLSFDFVHGYIGKIFSLLVLIALAYYVFTVLPELHNSIVEIFSLHRRLLLTLGIGTQSVQVGQRRHGERSLAEELSQMQRAEKGFCLDRQNTHSDHSDHQGPFDPHMKRRGEDNPYKEDITGNSVGSDRCDPSEREDGVT